MHIKSSQRFSELQRNCKLAAAVISSIDDGSLLKNEKQELKGEINRIHELLKEIQRSLQWLNQMPPGLRVDWDAVGELKNFIEDLEARRVLHH